MRGGNHYCDLAGRALGYARRRLSGADFDAMIDELRRIYDVAATTRHGITRAGLPGETWSAPAHQGPPIEPTMPTATAAG